MLFAAVAAAACACSIEVTEPTATRWQAALDPIPPAVVMGSVAVLSFSDRAEASGAVSGGESGATYAWNVRTGTCAEEGTIFGGEAVYPLLVTGSAGSADDETTVAGTLQSGSSYAAWLYRVTETDDRIAVACGPLVLQSS